MTKDDFIKKYGDRKVKFSDYYKYVFTFEGSGGLVIYCGGFHDEIYRFDVEPNKPYTVRELSPFYGKCGDDEFPTL